MSPSLPIPTSHSNPTKVSADDQVKAYIKKIMSQLNRWMAGGKISKLVVVITDRETGEHVERWQFEVGTQTSQARLQARFRASPNIFNSRLKSSANPQRARALEALVTKRTRLQGKSSTYYCLCLIEVLC